MSKRLSLGRGWLSSAPLGASTRLRAAGWRDNRQPPRAGWEHHEAGQHAVEHGVQVLDVLVKEAVRGAGEGGGFTRAEGRLGVAAAAAAAAAALLCKQDKTHRDAAGSVGSRRALH